VQRTAEDRREGRPLLKIRVDKLRTKPPEMAQFRILRLKMRNQGK
jgi:hypothetical protein